MDQVQLCLFVALTFSCLHQLVTPIPMVIDGDLVDYDTNVPLPITEDIFDVKDKADMYDPTSLLLTRFRRNTAQWLLGSQHYNDYNQGNRRFAHRRINGRTTGGGQIADA
ncbi:hypothetical protein BsWGS_09109 [Bradybaena similaris]